MDTREVKVHVEKLGWNANLPEYKTSGSAGMDVYAFVKDGVDIVIAPGERALISAGIKVALPEGFELQVRPRSGLAWKNGITVLNAPGTIDDDYRDEVGVILLNTSNKAFRIQNGDRIAQLVIAPVWKAIFEVVDDVEEIGENRGGGFGSTGV